MHVAAKDIGGISPRKILYSTDTGAVKLKKLAHDKTPEIVLEEKNHLEKVSTSQGLGSVELF